MSRCPDDNLVALYIHGHLDRAQRDAIEDHMDRCPACRQLVASLVREPASTERAQELARRPATLTPGTEIDEYHVIRLLGRGAMSNVYLARDTRLGRKVALKLLRAPAKTAHVDAAGVPLEPRAIASVNHPHIVTLYAVGTFHGVPYLALDPKQASSSYGSVVLGLAGAEGDRLG